MPLSSLAAICRHDAVSLLVSSTLFSDILICRLRHYCRLFIDGYISSIFLHFDYYADEVSRILMRARMSRATPRRQRANINNTQYTEHENTRRRGRR